ncbi:MAG: hypothetical protein ACI4MT_04115 [Christensenellales bacterium]
MLKEFIYLIETESSKETLLGRRIRDYVLRALERYPVEIVGSDFNNSLDPIADVTYVLYLDMPLITKATLEYVYGQISSKRMSRMNFLNGYAVSRFNDGKNYFLNIDEFLRTDSAKNRYKVYNELSRRIIDKHLSNGVYIDSPHVVIDDAVIIKSGARIEGVTCIKGNSYIGKSRITSSEIVNSVIGDDAKIEKSYIKNTNIADGITVGAFSVIESKEITKDVST